MKLFHQVFIVIVLIGGFVVGRYCFPLAKPIPEFPYEFHGGADGQIFWRGNRQTGEITVQTTNAPVVTSDTKDIYSMWQGKFADYLINKQTGEIWRYYKNTDTNGLPSSEGFTYLMANYPYMFRHSSVATQKALETRPEWGSVDAQLSDDDSATNAPKTFIPDEVKSPTAEQFPSETNVPDWVKTNSP